MTLPTRPLGLRRLVLPLLLLPLMGLISARAGAAAPPAPDSRAVAAVKKVVPSVVNISVWRNLPVTGSPDQRLPAPMKRERFFGSGFVIDPSGIIVTNKHVVENADTITVGFEGDRRYRAHILSSAVSIDIALIKIEAAHPLPVVEFGDSDSIQVGQSVLAIGNPLSVGISVTSGVVSALNRDIHDTPFDDYVQTDASTNPGSSGGPLIDLDGRVVGMDTAYLTGKSNSVGSIGIAFALPSSGVTFVVERLLRYGSVRVGWLGFQVQEVTPEMAEAMSLPKMTAETPPDSDLPGLVVTSVEAGEAAAKVGIRPGDVLYYYNGQPVGEPRALMRTIGRTDIGTTATLEFWREGKMITQPIVVEEWPAEEHAPPIKPLVTIYDSSLGLSLQAMLQSTDGTPAHENGVEVTAVEQESVAMYGGVQVGDVIAMVLETPVSTPADVFDAFAQARKAGRKFISMLIRRSGVPHWTTLPL